MRSWRVNCEICTVNKKIAETDIELEAQNLSEVDKQYWRAKEARLGAKEAQLRDEKLIKMKET